MNRLRKNDKVKVLTGKDKGRTGVIKGFSGKGRVLVEGINLIKKHIRPNPQKGTQGGIVQREASIHMSNVAIFNEATNKHDKVSYKVDESGKKVRVYRSTGEAIDA